MANNDSAQYVLRYNEISATIEAQIGLNWTEIAVGGGGTPGGSTTQIQFNNADAFAGDASLTYLSGSSSVVVGVSADLIYTKIQPGSVFLHGTSNPGVEFFGSDDADIASIYADGTSDLVIENFEGDLSVLSDTGSLDLSAGTFINLNQESDFKQNPLHNTVIANLHGDPASPLEGQIWYDVDTHAWRGYQGTHKGTFTFVND